MCLSKASFSCGVLFVHTPQLIYMVEGWAKERGASEIRLETWEFPDGPLSFYEQMGYQTLKRTMVHQICKEQESNG
jgi:GNAT superfamily N-acetyltransferase